MKVCETNPRYVSHLNDHGCDRLINTEVCPRPASSNNPVPSCKLTITRGNEKDLEELWISSMLGVPPSGVLL